MPAELKTSFMSDVRRAFFAAFIFLVVSPVNVWADMIDTSGMEPWEVCALCHSLDGISRMAKFPKLAGQRAAYIEKQFKDFHQFRRQNDGGQMQAITTEVAEGDLGVIAGYFAALPAPPAGVPAEDASGSDLRAAEDVFRHGRGPVPACLSCHGGGQSDVLAPWLEAQHEAYLAKQLRDFKRGDRDNDPAGAMQAIATLLSEKDIDALAAYLAQTTRPERFP